MKKTDIKFGCEFEFSSPWNEVCEVAKASISRHYGKSYLYAEDTWFDSVNNVKWHLKTDTSTVCELCTPVSFLRDLPKISKVVKDLRKANIKITRNDSLHLHVSAGKVDPRKVVAAWVNIERGIVKCFPKHRRHKYESDSFCDQVVPRKSGNVAKIFDECYKYSIRNHHAAMSLHHYEERKTAEFRIAEGTTDINMVKNWLHFCLQFMKYAENIDPFVVLCDAPRTMTIGEIVDNMKIRRKSLVEWLRHRYEKYG